MLRISSTRYEDNSTARSDDIGSFGSFGSIGNFTHEDKPPNSSTVATSVTCVKPDFRPSREWQEHTESVKFRDKQGDVVMNDTHTLTLLKGSTYTISTLTTPLLGRKEKMFVGYEQPYSKITYELDFLLPRGEEQVDIGCGTSVVGNGENDPKVPKSELAHPLSMQEFSFQFPVGRANLKADPQEYGHYPWGCPRYHRFRVTSPGNFTFVRSRLRPSSCCMSCMSVSAWSHTPFVSLPGTFTK